MNQNNYPYIICHMMTSLDGKIASGDDTDMLGDYFDLYTLTEDKYQAKAWMCGRVTMQMFASSEPEQLPTQVFNVDDQSYFSNKVSDYYMFGVDTKGLLRWNKNAIKLSNVSEELNLVIIVTKTTPKSYLAYLKEKGISYIVSGEDEIDFELLFRTMKDKLGIEKLLLEGGGIINGSVLSAGFIDEISLLLTPIVANRSKAPALFERSVDDAINITKFSLIELEKLEKDCVILRYKRK